MTEDCNDRCESCGRILDCCGNCPQDHEPDPWDEQEIAEGRLRGRDYDAWAAL